MITLSQIDDALFAALNSLAIVNGGPFNYVGRWSGEISRNGYLPEAMVRFPACLLALQTERASNDFESTAGFVETAGDARWTVIVVVSDARSAAIVAKGTPAAKGALDLADAVLAVLNNLRIRGVNADGNPLLRDKGVAYITTEPYYAAPGQVYSLAMRFSTPREIDDATQAAVLQTPSGAALVPLDDSALWTVADVKVDIIDPNAPNPITEAEFNPQQDAPGQITDGLTWWFRADSVTLVGTKVSAALDQARVPHNATQAVDAARPTWSATGGPNGLPCFVWSGAQILTTAAFVAGTTQLHAFYVVEATAAGVIAESGTATTVGQFGAIVTSTPAFAGEHYNTAGQNSFASGDVPFGGWHIVEVIHDKTQPVTQVTVIVDGVTTVQTPIATGGGSDPFASLPLYLGARSDLTGGLIGKTEESFGFARRLRPDERDNVLAYLSTRCAIGVP